MFKNESYVCFLSVFIYTPSKFIIKITWITNTDLAMRKLNWQKIQPFHTCKPTERWGHSSCVIGSDLIIFGGYADSNYMNDVWVFNTITLEWKIQQTTGNIPEARSNATLNYHRELNQLVLFGGGGQGKKRFNSIYTLDWNTKKWRQIQPKNHQNSPWERTYHVSQIIGKNLIIFGGENFADLNDIWLFDLAEQKWQQVDIPVDQTKPAPRRFHTSIIRNNQLIVIGGCHSKYRSLKDIFKMNFSQFLITKNPTSLKWQQVVIEGSDFIPRWGHSSTYNSLNDKVYIFGGRFSSDLQDIIVLDIEKRKSKKIPVMLEDIPCPRRRHSANFIGSSLLVFGGFNGSYFNDLYSICIPSQNPSAKYTRDSTIPFSKYYKKEPTVTVSFLQRYLKQFEVLHKELRQKFTDEQLDEILTSVVRRYALVPNKYTSDLQYLEQFIKKHQKNNNCDPNIHSSKQHKIEQIRYHYTQRQVLQQKISPSKIFGAQSNQIIYSSSLSQKSNIFNGRQNCFSLNNFSKLCPQHQVSSQIICVSEEEFYQYMQDHGKIIVDKQRNDCYQFENPTKIQNSNQDILTIEFTGIGKFILDPIVRFTNPYFHNCLKNSSTVSFECLDSHNLKVFEVGIMFIQTSVLVVPKNFTFQQWKSLAYFGNYFCVQNLNLIIEKFLINKVQFRNIAELSSLASSLRMTNLMRRCSQLIIQRQQQKFFLQNKTKKITPHLFLQFQHRFFSNLSNFLYSLQFQSQLTNEFQINKLNILIKNIQKMRQMGNNEKNKMNDQNQQKQNEQNLINARVC